MKTVAIDFDGPIHLYSKGWHDGTIYDPPVEGSLESLEILRRKYCTVIFTTRDAFSVAIWLQAYGTEKVVPYWSQMWDTYPFWNDPEFILVTNLKPAAIAYIDDRGIRFKNWTQVHGALERYTGRP